MGYAKVPPLGAGAGDAIFWLQVASLAQGLSTDAPGSAQWRAGTAALHDLLKSCHRHCAGDQAAYLEGLWSDRSSSVDNLRLLPSEQLVIWSSEATLIAKAATKRQAVDARQAFAQWVSLALEGGGRAAHRYTAGGGKTPPAVSEVSFKGDILATPPEVMVWRVHKWRSLWKPIDAEALPSSLSSVRRLAQERVDLEFTHTQPPR